MMNNHLQLKSIGVKFMKIFLEYDKKNYIFHLRNEVLTYKARYFSMFRLTRTYTRGHVW